MSNKQKLKKVGFWKELHSPIAEFYGPYRRKSENDYPDVNDFVDIAWRLHNPDEYQAVVDFLHAGSISEAYRGISQCRICLAGNGSCDITDGTWVWPEGFIHYIENHGVRPPQEFIEYVLHSYTPHKVYHNCSQEETSSVEVVHSILVFRGRNQRLSERAVAWFLEHGFNQFHNWDYNGGFYLNDEAKRHDLILIRCAQELGDCFLHESADGFEIIKIKGNKYRVLESGSFGEELVEVPNEIQWTVI